jgi:hypothetical protein
MARAKDAGDRRSKAPAIDPTEFLEQLRDEHQVLQWEPLPPPPPNRTLGVEQERNRASLEYLHHHWQLPHTYAPDGGGDGAKGKAVGLFGRLTFRVLGRYLREERDLLSHVVQVSEALERRCDQLTLIIQELHTEVLNRQVAEAKNQAILAVWLHAQPPAGAGDGPAGAGAGTRAAAKPSPASTKAAPASAKPSPASTEAAPASAEAAPASAEGAVPTR